MADSETDDPLTPDELRLESVQQALDRPAEPGKELADPRAPIANSIVGTAERLASKSCQVLCGVIGGGASYMGAQAIAQYTSFSALGTPVSLTVSILIGAAVGILLSRGGEFRKVERQLVLTRMKNETWLRAIGQIEKVAPRQAEQLYKDLCRNMSQSIGYEQPSSTQSASGHTGQKLKGPRSSEPDDRGGGNSHPQ